MSHKIHSLEIGPMDNLIHILEDTDSKKAIVFDPAWGADTILDFLDKKSLVLDKIVQTHSHIDHINALDEILAQKKVPVYISRAEYEFYAKEIPNVHFVDDGDEFSLGNTKIKTIFTPGHTPGSMCYLIEKNLICGDTLFVYGCGICSLAGGDARVMFKSLSHLKSLLDADTVIYPSHTYSVTKTGKWSEQLSGNPFLMIENEADFVRFRMEIHDEVRKYPMGPISQSELAIMLAN